MGGLPCPDSRRSFQRIPWAVAQYKLRVPSITRNKRLGLGSESDDFKPKLDVHNSFKVLHIRTYTAYTKALRIQRKELGRTCSQPLEGISAPQDLPKWCF